MHMVVSIIRPDRLDLVKEALTKIGVNGMTVSQVMGFGSQRGWKEVYRGSESAVKFLPKIKIETVIPGELVDQVVKAVADTARTGEIGDGKIFSFPISNVTRIRTGESGDIAI
ncbi:MAG: P-II family nitrogen regulator [Firmicutes bacterium]|nr:P-II family nitrogen regulator [Bacillota bacterium]